ncbi:hypothetical protein BZL39_J05870 [Zygosaccharomyces parabailii]|nr:hypothetical protein BZL39_J05870 [Zygosaccharomyces parabailii]SJM88907.1 related to MFS multidrug transporter [Zygosaccharomyces bailii]
MQKQVDEETLLLQDSKDAAYVIQINSKSEKTYVLVSLYVGVLLAALDGTVVASLLSHIASELGNLSFAPWIASSYMILSSAFQPLFGKLSDVFGRKRCLLACHTLFAFGSLLSGLSNGMSLLIIGRCIQGIGGGGLVALSSIVVSDMIPLRERGIYQGIGNISFGVGASLGGSFGGIVSDRFGWRYAFLGQITISCVAMSLVYSKLNEINTKRIEDACSQLQRVDFAGSFSLLGSLIFFFLALNLGGKYAPWRSPQIVLLLLLFVVLFLFFLRAEHRHPKKAIVPLNLFRSATVCICSILCLLSSMAAYSYIFNLPIYIEIVLGKSASASGLILAVNFIGVMFGSLSSGFIMRATGGYKVLLLLSGLIYFVNCSVLYHFDVTTPTKMQALTVCCLGFGYSSIVTVSLVALMSSVSPRLQAVSSSVLYASRGFGSTVGVAVSSSIFANSLRYYLSRYVTGPERQRIIDLALSSSDAVKTFPTRYKLQAIQAYMSSLKIVFGFILILSALIWLVSIPMKQHALNRPTETLEEA